MALLGAGRAKGSQSSESNHGVTKRKHDSLVKDLQQAQGHFAIQQQDLDKKLRTLQERNRLLQEDVDESRTEISALERQHDHQFQELESKHVALQKTLSELRNDLESKTSTLQTTQERLSQRELEVGRLENEKLRLKAQTGDTETLEVIKRELTEQVTHIKKLESTNREQSAELKHFRRMHRAVEIVEEEKKALENQVRQMEDLQRELGEAQLQRQILEDERKSWTAYLQTEGREFESPEALVQTLVKERAEQASLMEKIGRLQPELKEKDGSIEGLEAEKNSLRLEVENLRASTGGGESRLRGRLERQRALAVKEVEYLREQLRTFDNEETIYHPGNHFDELKTKRIQDLESAVDQYRNEVQALNQEFSKQEEAKPTAGPTLKRAHNDDTDERLGQLLRKNHTLQEDLSALQQAHTILEKEFHATKIQLNSLQSSSRTRVLELRSNPTANAEAVKVSTLTALRSENAALLAQLESQPVPTKVVPISTLELLRMQLKDTEAAVADKEKHMLRLKQKYSELALDLREAVSTLLGWQINPMPNGRFRLTSILYPGDQDEDGGGGNSLIFNGETGEFKISGGPQSDFAREIRGLIRFWVEERKEIPGFLAAFQLEQFEKTTRATRALQN